MKMKVLVVSRYKNQFADHQLPFVTEQGESLKNCIVDGVPCVVEFFLIKGNYIKAVKTLKLKIREFNPDIVHAHFGLSAITAELQSLCPVVTTFHNGEILNWKVNFITSLFSLRAKHVVYVAEHIRQKALFVNKNSTILPCGVCLDDCKVTSYDEARKMLGFDANTKYVLFGGAFSNTRKNVALLRDAVESPLIHENFKVEILEMKGLTREECVLRMCACDAFALPSKAEGSPQALKEAMACGCPCIATDIADVSFLLDGVRNSYVTGFDAQEIAVGLKRMFDSGERTDGRRRIIELGYTNESVAEKLMYIYQSVLK